MNLTIKYHPNKARHLPVAVNVTDLQIIKQITELIVVNMYIYIYICFIPAADEYWIVKIIKTFTV